MDLDESLLHESHRSVSRSISPPRVQEKKPIKVQEESKDNEPAEDLNKFRNLDPDGNIGPDGGQNQAIFQDIMNSISSERHISREELVAMFPSAANRPNFFQQGP